MSDTNMNTKDILQGIKNWVSRKLSAKSNIDGFYETMGVGTSMNLVGKTENTNNSMYRKTGGAEEATDGTATLKNIKGNSVKWNQMQRVITNAGDLAGGPNINISVSDGVIHAKTKASASGTGNRWVANNAANALNILTTHKYLFYFDIKAEGGTGTVAARLWKMNPFGSSLINTTTVVGEWVRISAIVTNTDKNCPGIQYDNTNFTDVYYKNVMVIDLTLIYGADNEPSTVAQFESDYFKWFGKPLGYEPYDAGSLRNVQLDAIKTIGFNQWDEEWELGIWTVYGTKEDRTNSIRSKNKIRVIPSQTYYVKSNVPLIFRYYHNNGTVTSTDTNVISTITIPSDVEEMSFCTYISAGITTYPGDWCINLSNPSKNGTYEPYEEHIASVPTTTLTGKLNGEGSSVVVFPDGMKKAGSVYDEIVRVGNVTKAIKRVGSVDLGTLTWEYSDAGFFFANSYIDSILHQIYPYTSSEVPNICCPRYNSIDRSHIQDIHISSHNSGDQFVNIMDTYYGSDASSFKTSLSGVYLYYELATPQEYLLDDFELPKPYVVNGDGTEEQIQKQGVQGVASTLTCSYGMDAVKTLMNLPQRFVSAAEEQNFSESQKASARRNIGVEEILAHKANQEGVYEGLTVGLADNLRGDNVVGAEFYRRKSGGAQSVTSGIAAIKEVKGKSIVWNQLVKNGDFSNGTNNWNTANTCSISASNNVLTATYTNKVDYRIAQNTGFVAHKYYVSFEVKPETTSTVYVYGLTYKKMLSDTVEPSIWTKLKRILNLNNADFSAGSEFWIFQAPQQGSAQNTQFKNIQIIDLTLMFGAGNEPATVEEFENMFPLDYYDYNAGEVIPFAGENLVTTGFNQWDEEWEEGGIDSTSGVPSSSNTHLRSKNYIPAIGGTSYHNNNDSVRTFFYDSNKSYINSVLLRNFVTPANCRYMKIHTGKISYGYNTYNHDICINISDPDKNGTYEPYEKHTLPLDPSQWRDKNGDLVFPYGGMHGTGTAYDYAKVDADGYIRKAVRVFGSVDLGTLMWGVASNTVVFVAYLSNIKSPLVSTNKGNIICYRYTTVPTASWNSNTDKSIGATTGKSLQIRDASYDNNLSGLQTSLNGLSLYYELAEPVEVELATPVYANYYVNGGGTEAIEPDNGAAPYTTPANLSILYAMDARGEINNLPKNYLSKESAENMLGAMQTAGIIGGYTMTFDSATNRYVFTITAPAAPNE